MWDGEGVGRLGHVLKGRRWDLVPQARLGISEAGGPEGAGQVPSGSPWRVCVRFLSL